MAIYKKRVYMRVGKKGKRIKYKAGTLVNGVVYSRAFHSIRMAREHEKKHASSYPIYSNEKGEINFVLAHILNVISCALATLFSSHSTFNGNVLDK